MSPVATQPSRTVSAIASFLLWYSRMHSQRPGCPLRTHSSPTSPGSTAWSWSSGG
jgi:hypothetical protein